MNYKCVVDIITIITNNKIIVETINQCTDKTIIVSFYKEVIIWTVL